MRRSHGTKLNSPPMVGGRSRIHGNPTLWGVAYSRRRASVANTRDCCIKPSRQSCCAIAEMAARAAGCDDLGGDAPRVTEQQLFRSRFLQQPHAKRERDRGWIELRDDRGRGLALHALLLLGKARLEPAVALGDARLARLRGPSARGAPRFSSEIRAVCGLFEGPGLRESAGGVAWECSASPRVLFAPSALGRRSGGARES
jgi:hypothetical protein